MNADKKSGPAITVIVPFFNEKRYLSACVESVLAQTFLDYELLLVDDGSTDDSSRIAKEAAERDPRVRFIEKEHSGLSATRNRGLENAQGEFVTFLDADDQMRPSLLETLYHAQREHNSDWTVCEYCNVIENTGERRDQILFDRSFYAGKEEFQSSIKERVLCNPGRCSLASTYAKIYRRDIIAAHGLSFNEKMRLYEDCLFNYTYAQYVTSFTYCRQPHYDRLLHDTSETHAFRPGIYDEERTAINAFLDVFEQYYGVRTLPFHFSVLMLYDIMKYNVFHEDNKEPQWKRYHRFYRFVKTSPASTLWNVIHLKDCRGFHETAKVFCFRTHQLWILEGLYRVYYRNGR